MDKNMIHIDDLVKQKLSGAEEEEHPGAWLNMREMLDRKIPAGTSVGHFGLRRILGIIAGVAAFSAVSIGGYHAVTSTMFRQDDDKELKTEHSITVSSNRSDLNGIHGRLTERHVANDSRSSGEGRSNYSTTGTTNANLVNATDKNSAAGHSSVASSSSAELSSQMTSNSKRINSGSFVASGNSNERKQSYTESGNRRGSSEKRQELVANEHKTSYNNRVNKASDNIKENKSAASLSNSNKLPGALEGRSKPVVDRNRSANGNKNQSQAGSSNDGDQQKLANRSDNLPLSPNTSTNVNTPTTKNRGRIKNNESASESALALNSSTTTSSSVDNTASRKNAVIQDFSLQKDTFQKMTILQRYVINPLTMTGHYITDTVSIERMTVDNNILSQLPPSNKKGLKNTPAAKSGVAKKQMLSTSAAGLKKNSTLNTTEKVDIVPLANFKVRSRKTNAWDVHRFDEAVKNVKFNMAQVQFYPGLIFGLNSYLFSPNNLSGFQLGLTGLFTFGETWSVMTELKYVQRMNNGTTLEDNYNRLDSTVQAGNKVYLKSKVEHFFKFSTIQSLEMPISLRYAMGRLNLMGGINMAYNFRINAEDIEHRYEPDSLSSLNAASNLNDMTPAVSLKDFNSRFSIGYLVGFGYQMSPALQLDFRMTKNVWDNATGDGALKVSRQFYRAPSFQLSIGYRFSQRNRLPRAK